MDPDPQFISPRVENAAPLTPAVAAALPLAAETPARRILFVDDEQPLVFLSTRILRRLGHQVSGHVDPAAALREFAARPDDYDILISDCSMPGMSGFELARRVFEIRPAFPVVLTSGFVRDEDSDVARSVGVRFLVAKPNTLDALASLLRDVMEQSASPPPPAPGAQC